MNKIKEFLDKHHSLVLGFEVDPEGIDQDTTEYVVWLHLKDSDKVPGVCVRGNIFDNLEQNLEALFQAAGPVFGFDY